MDAEIRVLLCHRRFVDENFGLHPPTREKREKDVFKNQIPLRRAFRLKSVYRRIHVHGTPR